jgi:hypothetical protein
MQIEVQITNMVPDDNTEKIYTAMTENGFELSIVLQVPGLGTYASLAKGMLVNIDRQTREDGIMHLQLSATNEFPGYIASAGSKA